MARVSVLLGVYCALHMLFADAMADLWVRLPNSEPVFLGHTPIEAMVECGVVGTIEVRRYVDALRNAL